MSKLYCEECLAHFEDGERIYRWKFGKREMFLCCECFESYIGELFTDMETDEKAALFGVEVDYADI